MVGPRSWSRWTVLALVALWPFGGIAFAQSSASATARIEPDVVGVGQVVNLILEARGTGLTDLELEPQFALENLEIVGGPMQSQTWQFVNGRASRSESLSWQLRAKEVGPARVSRITLKVNEEVFELPDQVVDVQKEPIASIDPSGRALPGDPFESFSPFLRRARPNRDSEPKLFLRAEISPEAPFAGQQALYTLYLFTQADVGAIDPESVPDFEGFWVEDVPQPDKLRPEMVDIQGQRYGRVVLLRKAVFPMRPGKIELEPVRARLIVSMPEYSWLGSVIDRKREIVRTSNAVTIDVRPLPEQPEGFHGAVGRLGLSAVLEPSQLRVGEAATLIVSLEGQGNIQGLEAPELPTLDGIRIFPPEQSSRSEVVGTRIRGEKTWTYVLVPDRAGEWRIPPLAIQYFDPFEESYRAAKATPATLVASQPLGTMPSVGVDEVPNAESRAGTVGPGTGSAERMAAPWFRRPVVLIAPGALAAALILLPFALRVRTRTRSTKLLRQGLRAASAIPHGRKAAEALESAWREFLEKRYAIGEGIAATAWVGALRASGVGGAALAELGEVVEDLEYLRYAPELSASEALIAEVIARSLRLTRSLR